MDEAIDPEPTPDSGRRLGGAMLEQAALDDLMQTVVQLARHTVGPAHSVSITVADNGGFRTSNSTDDEALAIDLAQYEGGAGPCVQALTTASQVQVAVGTDRSRWPEFDAKAQEAGVVAVLSTPLRRSPGDAIGALNIYTHDSGGFDDKDRRTAELIADHGAILLGNTLALLSAAQLTEQLRQALASREIIGEAKGIIMERQGCTRDEAFDILRRASQRENRKLREMAEELVARVEARKREGRSPL